MAVPLGYGPSRSDANAARTKALPRFGLLPLAAA